MTINTENFVRVTGNISRALKVATWTIDACEVTQPAGFFLVALSVSQSVIQPFCQWWALAQRKGSRWSMCGRLLSLTTYIAKIVINRAAQTHFTNALKQLRLSKHTCIQRPTITQNALHHESVSLTQT